MSGDWRDGLSARGKARRGVELAKLTWLRVGGPASLVVQPESLDDVVAVRRAVPAGVEVLPIGVGSNLLVRDGGFPGVVLRMAGGLDSVRIEGDVVVAGAGVLDRRVAALAGKAGVSGLEFLTGIPGTLGGAVRMNAGCFGGELAHVLESAIAVDQAGNVHVLRAGELAFAYRRSALPAGWIVTEVRLRGRPGDPAAIARRTEAIRAEREASQPLRVATGGSTFKNPPGQSAWRLIDQAGCRGLRRGGAMVSEKHCNFLINTGDASAADLEGLGEEVRTRVLAESNIELAWEIIRIGENSKPAEKAA
ncbi:UDP-N-acetylmuramate dehydrogenase [Marinivivus vitaminiproducens]|uniref:UDP-N-acetylmuramate dehydrogenase n=1 Tax=Marinivivus vitaminiproducens TaxID=3035935 RepID=UPI0027A2AC49|nr:UDP-N-acetylmuramate dehydrogenase [Geminicoccaceae bacterium SCSIO 64248]